MPTQQLPNSFEPNPAVWLGSSDSVYLSSDLRIKYKSQLLQKYEWGSSDSICHVRVTESYYRILLLPSDVGTSGFEAVTHAVTTTPENTAKSLHTETKVYGRSVRVDDICRKQEDARTKAASTEVTTQDVWH